MDATAADGSSTPQPDGSGNPPADSGAPGDATADQSTPPVDSGAPVDAALDAEAKDADPYADADPVCAHYAAPPTYGATTVKVTNMRASDIYFGPTNPGTCDDYDVGFTLTDGAQTPYRITRSNCELTCGELQAESCPSCTPSCSAPVVTLLAPGKTYDFGWPGTVFIDQWMPPSCYGEAGCVQGPCLKEVAATGTLTVTVKAYSAPVCDAGICDCTPGATGNCTIAPSVVGGTTYTGTATWAPGQSVVQVNIQ
jgi:hypothetical protein